MRGSLFDNAEVASPPGAFARQNDRMLKVDLAGTEGHFFARQGSMVAYQGEIDFAYQGSGGMAKMFKKAVTCGLAIDPAAVTSNAARMKNAALISTHGAGLVEGRDRAVRWNDAAHSSVTFRPSDQLTHYHNPPANLVLVDDEGIQTGRFQVGVGV